MNEDFLSILANLLANGESLVVATLVTVRGSAPQEVGARIIVNKTGLIYGTVGGGKVEAKAILQSKKILEEDCTHHFAEWNLQTDVGMTCGGVVGFFFEKVLPRSNFEIAIFGAGHVSQELVRLLIKLECSITCVDSRKEWLDKLPEHYRLKKIQIDDMKSILKTLSANTFVASLTMGHAVDLPILELALRNYSFPFVGVIGSESKKRVIFKDLENLGLPKEKINKLICPIGERFGNNSPYEISLSIVAQLLRVRDSFS